MFEQYSSDRRSVWITMDNSFSILLLFCLLSVAGHISNNNLVLVHFKKINNLVLVHFKKINNHVFVQNICICQLFSLSLQRFSK